MSFPLHPVGPDRPLSSHSSAAPPVGSGGHSSLPARCDWHPSPRWAQRASLFPLVHTRILLLSAVCKAPLPPVGKPGAPLLRRARRAPPLPAGHSTWIPLLPTVCNGPLPPVGKPGAPLLRRARRATPLPAGRSRCPLPARQAHPPRAEMRCFPPPPLGRAQSTHLPTRGQPAFLQLPHPASNREKEAHQRPPKREGGEERRPSQCAPVRGGQLDCQRPTAHEWAPRVRRSAGPRKRGTGSYSGLSLPAGHDDCLGSPPRPGDRPHFIGHPVQRQTGKGGPTRDRQRGSCTGGRRPPRYAPGVRGAAEIPVPRKLAAAPLPAIAPGVQRKGRSGCSRATL